MPTSVTSPPPVSPSLDDEVSFISGVTSTGTVAAISGGTWTGEGPDSNTPDAVATYNSISNASKWAPGGPSAGPSAIGSAGGTQYYYFDAASNYTAAQQTALSSGLKLWSAVANIQFVEITAAEAAANPTMASLDFQTNTTGGNFESSGGGTPVPVGSTQLNNQGAGTYLTINVGANAFDIGNFNDGGSGIGVILHEEGHFLGLGHGGPYNGSNDSATQQFSAYDSHQYDLMSYISANDPNEKYAASNPNPGASPYGDSTTWMPLDILAVQRLYGVATTGPLSGGQVFGYNDNVDGLVAGVGIHDYFDFSKITTPVVTLYDTGTGNTLDLSGDSSMETIDLRAGHYSSFAGLTYNLAIAYNTAIDTFIGGSGGTNVTVNGNADTIVAQGSNNIVNFSGVFANYVLTMTGMAKVLVTSVSSGITNMLSGVQTLIFSDQSVQTDSIPCYCPGTLILTPLGEVLVENLAIGDLVTTASNRHEPIRWIGSRSYAGAFVAGRHLMLPVCFRTGSLGDGVPHTDLWVSPGHGMFVDGQLVPAWRLINGVSVVQADAVDEVTYIHIELERHAIMLANGATAESFLDETGFRGQFHNAAEFYARYPDAAAMTPIQARLEDGFILQRIQERLDTMAGLFPVAEPAGVLRGFVDQAGPGRVCGWAQDVDSPEEPVALEVLVGGMPVLCVLANGWRADLRKAGLGSGCHAFDVALPEGAAGLVSVRRATDGIGLALADAATEQDQRLAA